MHSGHYAAQNIHKFVLKKHVGQEPKFAELQEVPPMIGLAVGKTAVASGPEGTVFGEDVMQAYFKHDLGFTSKSIPASGRVSLFLLTSENSLLGLDGPRRTEGG